MQKHAERLLNKYDLQREKKLDDYQYIKWKEGSEDR